MLLLNREILTAFTAHLMPAKNSLQFNELDVQYGKVKMLEATALFLMFGSCARSVEYFHKMTESGTSLDTGRTRAVKLQLENNTMFSLISKAEVANSRYALLPHSGLKVGLQFKPVPDASNEDANDTFTRTRSAGAPGTT